MFPKNSIHIQSEEAREKIVNRFCKLIVASALPSIFIYIYLNIQVLAIANGIVVSLFFFFIFLNSKNYFKISRTGIILTTNIGILFFSFYLGYGSGIYLYLFVAPLLIYLLVDFSEKKLIVTYFLFYLITFLLIYFYRETSLVTSKELSQESINFIYSFNFCSAFVLSFGLIIYFANNNSKYIANLTKHKQVLEEEVKLRNKSEELLKQSLNEQEILLAEIHHRVKNNLAIITALINMQMDNLNDEKSKHIFEETKNRIYALALIHNLLFKNSSLEKIDFSEYVNKFCQKIENSYSPELKIIIEKRVDKVEIDMKTTVSLALILNELITNAIKHAFVGLNGGKINISFTKIENDLYEFYVSDSGVGMSDEKFNNNTIGLEIIKSLVEQIDGKITYENNQGSNFMITIPIHLISKTPSN